MSTGEIHSTDAVRSKLFEENVNVDLGKYAKSPNLVGDMLT